jgi:DNA-binding NtrC family response regulator
VREALARILIAEGYQVRTAASVSTAVHRLSAESVDLVITDLRLPKINGLDLLFHYHFQRPRLPIFVITALPTSACEGAEKVATAFFSKPLDCDLLLSAVRQQLANRPREPGAVAHP